METERDLGQASGPKAQLIVLIRLQALDRERDGDQRLIDQTDGIVAARSSELELARVHLESVENDLKAAKVRAHEAEVDLMAQSEDVGKLELQLNTAKTNQEYSALQTHIEKIKQAASKEEEETLILYDRIEEQETSLKAAQARVTRLEQEFEQFQQTCEKDRQGALGDLRNTGDRREALLGELPDDLRSTYELIREARDGVVVTACEDRCCGGCGVRIRPNDLARLMAVTMIVYCESCQRVLYLPEALQAHPEP